MLENVKLHKELALAKDALNASYAASQKASRNASGIVMDLSRRCEMAERELAVRASIPCVLPRTQANSGETESSVPEGALQSPRDSHFSTASR